MSVYGLRKLEGEELTGDMLITFGKRTGLLGTSQGSLILFSSGSAASRFASVSRLEKVEIKHYDGDIGHFLVAVCSVDHFTSATLDGAPIGIFSCISGGFILPSHFYRRTERGIDSLYYGGVWTPEDLDVHSPTCGCGEMLIPYLPQVCQVSSTDVCSRSLASSRSYLPDGGRPG